MRLRDREVENFSVLVGFRYFFFSFVSLLLLFFSSSFSFPVFHRWHKMVKYFTHAALCDNDDDDDDEVSSPLAGVQRVIGHVAFIPCAHHTIPLQSASAADDSRRIAQHRSSIQCFQSTILYIHSKSVRMFVKFVNTIYCQIGDLVKISSLLFLQSRQNGKTIPRKSSSLRQILPFLYFLLHIS